MPVEKKIPRDQFEPLPHCQAYSQQTGLQCKKNAVEGKRVCRYHGGLTPAGKDSPNWKHGRYSKYLPANMLQRVKEAGNDPDLLSLREEITLIDARLMQLLERVEDGGGTTNWQTLNRTWRALLNAQRQRVPDEDQIAELARTMNDIIGRGLHDAMVWIDIQNTIESRRRLIMTESKRLVDMRQMITAERAINFAISLAAVIRERLTDYMAKGKTVDGKLINALGADIRGFLEVTPEPKNDDSP